MNRVYRFLNRLFWRKLCICPDRPRDAWTPLIGWWNWRTAQIAWFFHRRYCVFCKTGRCGS